MVQPLWKTFWQFLIKLNTHLPCDPAIPFLVSYTREMKHIHKKMYKNVHHSFIRNLHSLEITEMPMSRRVGKQTFIHRNVTQHKKN